MIAIEVDIKDQEILAALSAFSARARDLTPAMQDIGEHLVETTKRRFATSTDPDGNKWPGNKPSTLARHLGRFSGMYKKNGALSKRGAATLGSKKPLVGETKSLATTIYSRAGASFVAVGSPMVYAATQQFGAKKGSFGRTRRGASIPWGDIPARPFLGVSDQDWEMIRATILDYLSRV